MWERLVQEASSVLPTLKQITPSDRSGVSGNEGTWEYDKPNNPEPWKDKKIWGNLNGQSTGMSGKLDTQGKNEPELFTSKRGNTKSNDPGTSTPGTYKKMYQMHESANGEETGTSSGKHKVSAAANVIDPKTKHVYGADTKNGGSCNCGTKKRKPMTESQLIGSAMALLASHLLFGN